MKKKNKPAERKPAGYWTKDTTYQEAEKVYGERGYLPGKKELGELGYSSLAGQISKNFGFEKLREKLQKEFSEGKRNLESFLQEYIEND